MATTNLLASDRPYRWQGHLASSTSERISQALALLVEAYNYAEQTSGNVWEFAVEIQLLQEQGLSNNDLRYLAGLQYVEHATERIGGNYGRRFVHSKYLTFTNRSCFVLSKNGAAAVLSSRETPRTREGVATTIQFSDVCKSHNFVQVPVWDISRRILAFQSQVVKQFKRQAANQEVILSAFQDDGWPTRIDDPLAPLPVIEVKRRLSDAIKGLNRKQQHKLIHFRGDGTGQGVVWEPRTPHTVGAMG